MHRQVGLSGNTSGSLDRASALEKARLKEKEAFEEKKRELESRRQKSSFNYVDNLFEEVSHQEDEKESTKTRIIKDSDTNNNKIKKHKMIILIKKCVWVMMAKP